MTPRDPYWNGGRRPYGFTLSPDPTSDHQNSILVIDAAEAVEVRHASEQLLAGVSLRELVKDLRTREVFTVTGTAWTTQALRDVLMRPLNAGIMTYQGKETATRLPGESIVPEGMFRAVVAKLSDPIT